MANIYGKLKAVTADGVLADAEQIEETATGKSVAVALKDLRRAVQGQIDPSVINVDAYTKKETDGKIEELSKKIVTVDPEISDTSENPVQNKAVKSYVDSKEYTDKNTYATDTADADALVTEIFGAGSGSGGTVVPVDNSKLKEEIDGVYKKSNYNDGDNVVDFNTVHFIVDNPEYLYAIVDADDKLLFGIDRETGTAVFGVIPEQIEDYVDNKIAEASKATATVSTTTNNED